MVKRCILIFLLISTSIFSQEKISIDASSGKLDEATIQKLKASGLDDEMIKQLKAQMEQRWTKTEAKTQEQMDEFFAGFTTYESQYIELWYPKNYDPQKEIKILEQASKTFTQFFEAPKKKVSIVLFEDLKDLEYTSWERFGETKLLPFMISSAISNAWDKSLGHEVCHLFLSSSMGEEVSKTTKYQYGHGQAPDWFDEAVAVSCEDDELHKARLKGWVNNQNKPSLEAFFTQSHPLMSGLSSAFENIENNNSTNKRKKGGARVITLSSGDNNSAFNENIEKAMTFYSMAYVVGKWINDNSPQSWQKLANHYAAGGGQDYSTLKQKDLLTIKDSDLIID